MRSVATEKWRHAHLRQRRQYSTRWRTHRRPFLRIRDLKAHTLARRRGYDIPAGFVGQQPSLYRLPIVEDDAIEGAKLSLVAGYNAILGSFSVLKCGAMYNFNETSASTRNATLGKIPPLVTSWQWCGGCDFDNYPTAYDRKSYSIPSSNTQTLGDPGRGKPTLHFTRALYSANG